MSKKSRLNNLIEAEEQVVELEDEGHTVTRFSDVHWRIDEFIDVWPSSKKFMKRDGNWKSQRFNKMKEIFL